MHRKNILRIRTLVQGSFTLFSLYVGWRFYLFFQWAIGKSDTFVPRPSSVEGFLPISALVSFKRLLLTGKYDVIHPAGLTIFIAAILIAVFLRKGFCGWICPVGFTSNLAAKCGAKLRIIFDPPKWIDWPLTSLKYLLLAFFSYLIILNMGLKAIESFMKSPYNIVADAKMLFFFLAPSKLALWIMGTIAVISFVIRNLWCRYLCPYGALLGIFAIFSPFQVNRNRETCINCNKCDKRCPVSIKVSQRDLVWTPECIGCLECVAVCPPDNCLSINFQKKTTSPFLLPALILTIFFSFWLVAKTTGHWHQQIPVKNIQQYYKTALRIRHPK